MWISSVREQMDGIIDKKKNDLVGVISSVLFVLKVVTVLQVLTGINLPVVQRRAIADMHQAYNGVI